MGNGIGWIVLRQQTPEEHVQSLDDFGDAGRELRGGHDTIVVGRWGENSPTGVD